MCGNRVEELEARVKELEASVEGLTDELVECKVRIRELEGAVDEDIGFATEQPAADLETPDVTESADTTKSEAPNEEDKAEDSSTDIIVA
ncbi:bZIP transcription factor [Halobacteriales archaeon Cl-PHB]